MWDHTAELIAKMATMHCQGTYHASQFHPLREHTPLHLDDPAAEYERLKKREEHDGNAIL